MKSLALAVCWMMTGAIAYTPASTAYAQTRAAEPAAHHTFNIPAGSLDQALGRFGRQSGAIVSVNAALTAGVESPGLRGSYATAQALRQLLAGTRLEAVRDAGGEYTLRPFASVSGAASGGVATLAPVTVLGGLDGGVQAGYVTRDIAPVGPWEGRGLRDTPYALRHQRRVRRSDREHPSRHARPDLPDDAHHPA